MRQSIIGVIFAAALLIPAAAAAQNLPNGSPCTSGAQCKSLVCKHGVCCVKVCSQQCKNCAMPGKKGICTFVPKGQKDPAGNGCDNPIVACDGKGMCKLLKGNVCFPTTMDPDPCLSGHCVDSQCCDQACTAMCMDCALKGKVGTCSFSRPGMPDTEASKTCKGIKACDGKGGCKKANAQPCKASVECGSGFCVQGLCCDTKCDSTCMTCTLVHLKGVCSPVAKGKPDLINTPKCKAPDTCDGTGTCIKDPGRPCTKASECFTGHCADGYCCDKACKATCKSCALQGKQGTCLPVKVGEKDDTCTGNKACDGSGFCKPAVGQKCKVNADCANKTCEDGYCCKTTCKSACMSCGLTKTVGTCTAIPALSQPGKECPGKDPKCGGRCDGKGQCDYPGLGKVCGTCKACDGTGRCFKMPPDDIKCGAIDCDKLDTKCRDYSDIKSNRCDSFGACKMPNTPSACTVYTDLCDDGGGGTGDAGGGSGGDEEPDGCSCRVGHARGGAGAWLLLLGWLLARRRRRR